MTHTQGPWTADHRWVYGPDHNYNNIEIVATCEDDAGDDARRANARLIASAPTYHDILEVFVDCHPAQIEPLKARARAALAKTRG